MAKKRKKKSGALNKGKLVVLAVIVTAALVFSIFFKDKLITSAMERGISRVLETEVEINGLKSSILSSSLFIGSIKAGGTELSDISIDLEMKSLLKGSFIIEDLSGILVSWGTGKENTPSNKGEAKGEKKLIDFDLASLLPEGESFIEDHLSSFKAFGKIEKSREEINSASSELKDKLEKLKKETVNIKKLTDSIAGSKVTNVEEGLALLKKISEAQKEINKVKTESSSLQKEIQEKLKSADDDRKAIKESIAEDYGKLDNLVSDPAGAGKGFVSDYTEALLKEKTGRFYPLAAKAIGVLKNLVSKEPDEKQEGKGRIKGRNVYFAVKELPRFLLKKGMFSTADGMLAVNIYNVSSDPKLVKENTAFFLVYKDSPSKVEAEGDIVFPEGKPVDMNLRLTMSGFSISGNQFSCSYNADGEFSLTGDEAFSGSSDFTVINLHLENPEESSLVSSINDAISSSDRHSIHADFKGEKGHTSIKIKTSLDRVVSNASKAALQEASAAIKKKAREKYDSLLSKSMEKWGVSLDALKSDNLTKDKINKELSGYSKVLDTQKERIKKELAKYSGTDAVKDAVKSLKLPF